jgi:hypothetical protein
MSEMDYVEPSSDSFWEVSWFIDENKKIIILKKFLNF